MANKTTNLVAKKGQFINKRTGKEVPAGTKYHVHPDKGPMAGGEHNPNIKGGKKGHDFFKKAKGENKMPMGKGTYGSQKGRPKKKMYGGGMNKKMMELGGKMKEMKMMGGGEMKKPKMMDGGPIQTSTESPKGAGDVVATYQGNGQYKAGE